MQNCPYFNKKHIKSLVSEKFSIPPHRAVFEKHLLLPKSYEFSFQWVVHNSPSPATISHCNFSTWISCFLKVYFTKRILKCLCLIYTYWKRTLLGKRSYIMTITDENRSTLFIWRIAWSNGKKTLQEIKSESGDLYPIKLDTGFYHKVTFSLTLLSRISPS